MHYSVLASLLLLAPTALAQEAALLERPNSQQAAGEEEGQHAGKGGGAIPAGEGLKVFMSIHNINPLINGHPPDCGIFVQTNKPGPGEGTLLHVHGSPEEHGKLVFDAKEAHNPEGWAKHEVGRMLPMKMEEVLMMAKHTPPPEEKSHIKAVHSAHCLSWSKGLVAKLQAAHVLDKTAMQKAGMAYNKYSPAIVNGLFMAQFMGPQAVNALRNLSKGKKAISAQQLTQDENVMKQHMHTPGGPPPGYPVFGPQHGPKSEGEPGSPAHRSGELGHPYGGPAADHYNNHGNAVYPPGGPEHQAYAGHHQAYPAEGFPVYHPNGGPPPQHGGEPQHYGGEPPQHGGLALNPNAPPVPAGQTLTAFRRRSLEPLRRRAVGPRRRALIRRGLQRRRADEEEADYSESANSAGGANGVAEGGDANAGGQDGSSPGAGDGAGDYMEN